MARLPPCFAPDGLGYGDIDGDGYVTQADAEYIAKHVIGISGYPLSDAQFIRADVDGDGEVTQTDALLIAKYASYVAGYDIFPVCSTYTVEFVSIPAGATITVI